MQTCYAQLLQALAKHYALDATLLLDSQQLSLDELDIDFYFEGDDQQGDVAFFTRLCTLPAERLAELWRELLEADNLWAGAFGYVLGLQYGCNIIVLSGRLPIERLSARALAAVLSHFSQVAHGWRSHLTQTTLAGAKTNGQRRFLLSQR